MPAQGLTRTMTGSAQLLLLVFRHIAAPFVSFVISYATFFVLTLPVVFVAMTLKTPGEVPFNILHAGVGFCGVFAGARFLPQASRRVGSFVLLLLGLYYYYHFVADWGDRLSEEGKIVNMDRTSIVRLIFLAIGGLLATAAIWWLATRPKESEIDKSSIGSITC